MSRKKLFIENIFTFGFINILNKIVPFLLLPVIAKLLPDVSDFGIYNMYTVILGFGTPLAIMGLYDAMFREYFEKDDMQYKYNVTTTAQKLILMSSLFVSINIVLFSNHISVLFFGKTEYSIIVKIAGIGVFLTSNLSPIQAPTRFLNEKKVFIVSGLMYSIFTYGLSVALIWIGFSYFGLMFANLLTSLIMLVFFWMRNKTFFLKGLFDKNIAKELFKIALPLLPTFLIYWIYDSMDKIMITNMLGENELGIYSIGAKVSQISYLIYAAFAGGWQYFAFSTMKDKDQTDLNSKIFEWLGVISILSAIIIYPFLPHVFRILFTGDYVKGYIVAPYIYLSPLMLMLFQVAGNQFIVIKKSYLSTLCLSFGAISNVILNYVLIQNIGIEGAAIATLVSYFLTIVMVIIITLKFKVMYYSKRVVSIFIITIIYYYAQRLLHGEQDFWKFGIMFLTTASIILIYSDEIKKMIMRMKSKELTQEL